MEIQTALVVDDSRVGRISLTKMLEKRAIEVAQADSGAAAIDYLKAKPRDVVFIDYMMPEMDGVETARRLSVDPATAHIPLYLYTGEEAGEAQQRAQEVGIRGFLSKPTPEDQLDRVLAEAAASGPPTPAPATRPAVPDPAQLETLVRQTARTALEEVMAGPLAEQLREAAQIAVAGQIEQLAGKLQEQAVAAARESAEEAVQESQETAKNTARETAESILRQSLFAMEATARREAEDAAKSIGTELWRELDRQLGAFLDSPALQNRLREVAVPAPSAGMDEQAVVATTRKVATETARAQAHEIVRATLAEHLGSRADGATRARAAAKQATVVAAVALATAVAAVVAALLL